MRDSVEPRAPIWRVPWSEDEGRERARQRFRAAFAAEPRVFRSAPGRVIVVGEHIDYSAGLALTTVAPHATYVAASPRDDMTVRVTEAQSIGSDDGTSGWEGTLEDVTLGAVEGLPAHVAGVLWALAERGYVGTGLDIAIASCVPAHAGLAPSASRCAAIALAVDECWGLALGSDDGRIELAEVCIDAEREYIGFPTAGTAQHTIMRCPPGRSLVLDFAEHPPRTTTQPLYFPDYGLGLLLIDIGTRHDHAESDDAVRRLEVERACTALGVESLREVADAPHALARIDGITDEVARRRARHVVTEIERVRLVAAELLGTAPAHERFVNVGKALYRSHASLELDYDVSSDALNLTVDAAFAAGALGARLIDGGFGDAALALVRREQAGNTAELITRAAREADLPVPAFTLI